jgi:hypothetical protein
MSPPAVAGQTFSKKSMDLKNSQKQRSPARKRRRVIMLVIFEREKMFYVPEHPQEAKQHAPLTESQMISLRHYLAGVNDEIRLKQIKEWNQKTLPK